MSNVVRTHEESVLVLAPTAADGALSQSVLSEAGFQTLIYFDLNELVEQLLVEAGALLLTDESLQFAQTAGLVEALEKQPHWSDLPVILLSASIDHSAMTGWAMEHLENVTILERPVRVNTLVSTLRAALRARRRQYELRDHLDALQRSEQQLRIVTDALPAVVVYVDREIRFRFFNRAMCDWFGLRPEELHGKSVAEIFGATVYEAIRPKLEEAFDGNTVQFETELPHRDGESRSIEVSCAPEVRTDGRIDGFVGLIQDVTERKRAAAALQESEERFRTLADNIAQFAWTCNDLGNATWYNQRWYDYTGTTWEEMKGRGWEHVVHPEHLARVNESLAEALRLNLTWENTFPLRGKDGRYRWFLSRGVPIRDADGNTIRWLGTNTDVTEQRTIQEALRDSESRMRQLLSLMPMAVYSCDAEGRISFFNRKAAELWGREPALGTHDEKFCGSFRLHTVDGARLPHCETPMARAIRIGTSCRNARVVIERPNGSRVTVSVNIDPVYDGKGNRVGAINVFEDVTERVRAEEALKTADRRKDEFLAMLAHELRNPLAPIRTGLQILELCTDDPDSMAETLGMMDRQVRQLVRLIDDLLDISRITRGKIELRPEHCELATIISSAVESSRPAIQEAGLELTVSTPRDPVELYADPARLSQVLSNLLANSAKYTQRKGHIWLTAEKHQDAVVVTVRDDGIGIPRDMLTRVFDMFTQVDTGNRGKSGLGIGLSLVRALVELHRGTIVAHSEGPEQGAEFILRLPVVMPHDHREQGPAPSQEYSDSAARQVLVVDDNRDAADTLSKMLRMMGHDVRTLYQGEQAISDAERFQPDLVLLDLGLPDMHGCEVARRIREQPWGKEMKLVAVTGWGQQQDRQNSKEAGFDAHLVKPVDQDAVASVLALTTEPRRA